MINPKDYIQVVRYENYVPFIYSNEQFIDIKSDIDSYELKFNAAFYNNDILFLSGENNNNIILDNCTFNGDILKCVVIKEKLEEILTTKNETFTLGSMNDEIGAIKFNFVSYITINHYITEKEDIYIGVIDFTNEIVEAGTAFGFVSNVTSLPNMQSRIIPSKIYYKKTKANPLLLLLINEEEDTINIKGLDKEMVLNNMHYKYNFRIQPFKFNKTIYVKNKGTEITLIYPEVLNFINEEEITVRLLMSEPSLGKNIRLNKDSYDLDCDDLIGMKKCIVHKSHFENAGTGYYYTYHSNHAGNLSIYYNSEPFNVITTPNIVLKLTRENNRNDIFIGLNGTIYIVTDYNDTETNIFK